MGQFDACISLLVAHLVPDDGRRAAFWHELKASLRAGGILLLAEIEALTAQQRLVWESWSQARGCDAQRMATLRARLAGRRGFPLLSPHRTRVLADAAGFMQEPPVFRALGVVANVYRKR